MKCWWLPFLLMLAASAGALHAADPVQRYRLQGSPDVASWLLLHSNGRFEYSLAAGALDESAQGRWVRDGETIYLTTAPKPKPAVFSLGQGTRDPTAPLTIRVVWPDGRGIAGVDLRLTFDAGAPMESYTQEDGWTLDAVERRIPRTIELAVPMHGLRSHPFAIDMAKANRLTFVLTPNDLGTVNFEKLPVTIGKDKLVIHRQGRELVYLKETQ